MKKILLLLVVMVCVASSSIASEVISNTPITPEQLANASKIMLKVHQQTQKNINKGMGPFYAMLIDSNGHVIAAKSNSVVKTHCCLNHAEMNTIRAAQSKLKTYDLSKYNLSIYVNAEPCVMCMGGIMWSGIKNIYYSVPSKDVERITGFNEGYKPNWQAEFKKMGINVYGNIETEAGEKVLENYVKSGHLVYKPEMQTK